MDINRVTGSGHQFEPLKSKKEQREPEKTAASKDTAEISDQAVLMSKMTEKRVEEIRGKIESGFYSHRDVTEKVVDAMMKDLKLL